MIDFIQIIALVRLLSKNLAFRAYLAIKYNTFGRFLLNRWVAPVNYTIVPWIWFWTRSVLRGFGVIGSDSSDCHVIIIAMASLT